LHLSISLYNKRGGGKLRHGSLFSGIGGFDLAATWVGWDNIFNCEKDPFCRKVLNHYWPDAKSYEDIYQFDATQYRGRVDIISGGFPCQPFSHAGKRKGKTDDRYLWPEARRIITEARPQWIVLENVAGLFTILEQQGLSAMEVQEIELFCKDGQQEANSTIIRLQRRIIGSIISEIGSAGYVLPQLEDGTPVVLCIPACALDAPHRRDRVWFVAHAGNCTDRQDFHRPRNDGTERADDEGRVTKTAFDYGCIDSNSGGTWADPNSYGNGQFSGNSENEVHPGEGWKYAQYDAQPFGHNVTDTGGKGLERPAGEGIHGTGREPAWDERIPGWDGWPAQPPVCGGNDGIPFQLDGITVPKWRTESIKGYGNAIVPQIALEIFKSINSSYLSTKN
jgi:DNA (cytosine-5)-methyltransferase 1